MGEHHHTGISIMPGVSTRRPAATSAEKPAPRTDRIRLEPMGPALTRGIIVLIAVATPIVVTLLSR